MAQRHSGLHGVTRDQWLRAAQSIPLHIAVSGGIDAATDVPPKAKLKRIVAMVTRLALRSDRVDESAAWYEPNIDDEHEHEHEHEYEYEHRFA